MPKVLICVPTFENITPDTFKTLWDMEKPCETDFQFVRGYDVATARNKCAKLALEGDYTHLMMVDNDVTPPKDALKNLLEDRLRVVSGFYAHRGEANIYSDRTCVCRLFSEDGAPYFSYPLESEYTAEEVRAKKEPLKIHGSGMGCVLIDVTVFFELKYPYFDWVNYGQGGMLSEDLFFCEQLHANDIPIYVDPRVGCGHLMRRIQQV